MREFSIQSAVFFFFTSPAFPKLCFKKILNIFFLKFGKTYLVIAFYLVAKYIAMIKKNKKNKWKQMKKYSTDHYQI